MIFKQSNLIIALSIGLQIQSGNVNAFDLSDVTNAVDQVNSVAKQLNVPQPIPTTPTPTATASSTTEVPKEFQGKWVKDLSTCVGNPDEVIGLDISESYIEIGTAWGEQIKATKWIEQGTTIEIIGDSSGEDQVARNNDKQKLTLSDSGNSLSMTFSSGEIEKYSRCGSASTVAAATASAASEVLFSCLTKKGKMINLSKSGNMIQYSFGFPNKKPELVIDTPEDDVIYQYGSGRTIAAAFDKGALDYTVGYLETDKEIEGHNVFINGVIISNKTSYKTIAQVECVSSKTEEYQDKLESYIIKYQSSALSN